MGADCMLTGECVRTEVRYTKAAASTPCSSTETNDRTRVLADEARHQCLLRPAARRGGALGIRQETHLVGARALQEHHGVRHGPVRHRRVGSDQHGGLRIPAQQRRRARGHGGLVGRAGPG